MPPNGNTNPYVIVRVIIAIAAVGVILWNGVVGLTKGRYILAAASFLLALMAITAWVIVFTSRHDNEP